VTGENHSSQKFTNPPKVSIFTNQEFQISVQTTSLVAIAATPLQFTRRIALVQIVAPASRRRFFVAMVAEEIASETLTLRLFHRPGKCPPDGCAGVTVFCFYPPSAFRPMQNPCSEYR
jgi:hypothetical protein